MTESEVLEAFQNLEMPMRMRESARVLRGANARGIAALDDPWCPSEIDTWADRWEAENAKTAETDAAVEELAHELDLSYGLNDYSRAVARKLIEAGWTRIGVTDDE